MTIAADPEPPSPVAGFDDRELIGSPSDQTLRSLLARIPVAVPGASAEIEPPHPAPEDLLEDYAEWAARTGRPLYPAQEDALVELAAGSHVILGTPTGSGKSLVAVGAMLFALAEGRRTYYTAPIKALVSEKFFDLCDLFGPERVGMVTGDAAVNPEAPGHLRDRRDPGRSRRCGRARAADVGVVCMDEFHYYGDRDRGWAWQVPLIELTDAQFLLMSATLGDVRRIRDDLTRRTEPPAAVVAGGERPVPLTFEYAMTPIHETIEALLERGSRPDLRRASDPGRSPRTRPGADQHQPLHPRGEGRDRRGHRRLPLHRRIRADPDPARPAAAWASITPGCCRATAASSSS